MADPIEVRLVTSSSAPSGTGSLSYRGQYQIVVQNLAFEKQVAVRGTRPGTELWIDHPCAFQESLPDGRELWSVQTGDELVAFAANFMVRGDTFWDNNGGGDYHQPQVFDEFDALLGRVPAAVVGRFEFVSTTHLEIFAAVKNLAFEKQVGIAVTTNAWATSSLVFGEFDHSLKSGNEVWRIEAEVGSARPVEFALFYRVDGQEFWDNNFSRNYRVR